MKTGFWMLFLVSMMPLVELRGAMLMAAAAGVDFLPAYAVCVLGNLLPTPFLLFFARKMVEWLATWPKIGPWFSRLITKARVKAETIGSYELLGLFAFVAIPLPGTGAWTGSLVATFLQLERRRALAAISLGVLCSGLIMGVVSFGLFDLLRMLFAA